MGFQTFVGGEDTELLIADSVTSSLSALTALTDSLIQGGQLDPNAVLKNIGAKDIGQDGTLPVADTLSYFIRKRMESYIRQERNRFRRLKHHAKRRGLIVERNASVLRYGNTGREYVVREWEGAYSLHSYDEFL